MSLPYFKVHPPDFLNDYTYQKLSNEEFGIVIKLFMLMWQSNMQMNNDDINVAWQLRMDPQDWAKVKMKLMHLNVLFVDNGYLSNSMMKSKYLGAENYSKQQAENRKKRKKNKLVQPS